MSNHIGNINPIRYRGYYYDSETDLYYLEARYYDPETGRFISQDSIDFLVPDHLTGLNLYAYCSNNPIMYTDPSGNFFLTALIVGAIAGAVIGATVGGVSAYNDAKASGATGGELIGKTVLGAVGGGVIGAAAGAVVGAGAWLAASAITAGIGAIGTGISALSGSGMLAGSLATGGVVVSNGAVAATGVLVAGIAVIGITFASNNRPKNNVVQNKQYEDAARKAGLNPKDPDVKDLLREVHQYIRRNKLNLGWKDLVDLIKDFK